MSTKRCYHCGQIVNSLNESCRSCAAPLMLYGQYPVLGILQAQNENTIVYKAYHPRLRRNLVVKQALPHLMGHISNEKTILEVLQRRSFFTPHVYDFIEQQQYIALVTDFFDGETLDKVYPNTRWPVDEVVAFLDELLGHLAIIHSAQVIHRDIKPRNIIRRPDGSYGLIDFNIAKLKGSPTELQGFSPLYAPGEQLPDDYKVGMRLQGSRDILPEHDQEKSFTDERSDLYSLGVTAYELLVGQRPQVNTQQLRRIPREGVPPALEATLRWMLAPKREERPPGATEALRELRSPRTRPLHDTDTLQDQGLTTGSSGATTEPLPPTELRGVAPTVVEAQTSANGGEQASLLRAFPAEEGRGRVLGIAWSPRHDEQWLAVATARGVILEGGRGQGSRLFCHTAAPVRAIGWTCSGQALGFCVGTHAEVRSVEGGHDLRVVALPEEGDSPVVAFSPATRSLVLLAEELLRLVPIEGAGQPAFELPLDYEADPRLLAWSFNGQQLAVATGDMLLRWQVDATSLVRQQPLRTLPTPLISLALSEDGTAVAAAAPHEVRVWRNGPPPPLRSLAALLGSAAITAIALAPDGQRLAVATSENIWLYRLDRGQQGAILGGELPSGVFQLAFDPTGALVAAASPDGVWVWETQSGAQTLARAYTTNPLALAFVPEEHALAAAGRDMQIWPLDPEASNPPERITGLGGEAYALAAAPGGRFLAAALPEGVALWERRRGGTGGSRTVLLPSERWQQLKSSPTPQARSVAFMANQRAKTARKTRDELALWHMTSAAIQVWPLKEKEQSPTPTALLADELASACDVAFAAGGWVAALYADRSVRVWHGGRANAPQTLTLDFDASTIALAPHGTALIAASEETISVLLLPSGERIDQEHEHAGGAERVVVSDDGALFAAISHSEVQVWRLDRHSAAPVCNVPGYSQSAHGHTDRITDVAFDPSRPVLASASWDGTVRLWQHAALVRTVPKGPAPTGPGRPKPPPKPRPVAPLQVFLSYANEDKALVDQIYQQLLDAGHQPWTADLLRPGDNWQQELYRQIAAADFFLACLSRFSLGKEGFVQRELDYAMQIAPQHPNRRFLLPIRLDGCKVFPPIAHFQYTDLLGNSLPDSIIAILAEYRTTKNATTKGASPNQHLERLIASQEELLAIHRGNLERLLKQRARNGALYVPIPLMNEIATERDEIARIKGILRGWGVLCPNDPNDEGGE